MSRHRIFRLLALFLVLTLVLGACRSKEEKPTDPVPSATSKRDDPVRTEPAVTKVSEGTATATPETTAGPSVVYDWAPQLVYSSPAQGEEVMLNGAITLRFDQPMDQGSVEAALRVSPLGKMAPVKGSIMWPKVDTLIFTPEDQLEREQAYEVSLTNSALAKTGQTLLEPVNLVLETVGYLEVSQELPAAGTRDVQTDAAITVVFNRPVVPLVSTGQQGDLPQPLLFKPTVVGQGEWVSTSIYRFLPEEPLAGATNYQVIVQAGLQDIGGGELAADHNWRFSTVPPSVVSTTPGPDDSGVDPTRPITITFNMPMDHDSTLAAVSLRPLADLNPVWSENDHILTLVPGTSLALETPYALEIDSSARSANGQASLDRVYDIRFTTVPYPVIVRTSPANGEEAEQYQRGVSIYFASLMDLDTLEDKVLITPTPDETRSYFNEYNNSLFIDAELDRSMEYVVTVPGSAADPFGNTLGEDYTWRFRTADYEPLVSMNLPEWVSQFSSSHPSDVDLIYRNVSFIDARLYDAGLPTGTLVQRRTNEFLPRSEMLRGWSIPVEKNPETAKLLTLSLADGGVLPTGVYYLEVDAPEIGQDQAYWQNQENLIVVGDTNLIVKEMFERVYIWATSLADGLPAAGLDLTLFDESGNQIGTAVSDENGLADFPYQPNEEYLPGVLAVSNSPGQTGFGVGGSLWSDNVTAWQFGLDLAYRDEFERFAYLYTDRPIYRPSDTVHFRGIVRDTNYGRYPFPTADSVTLGLEFTTNYETLDYQFRSTLDENGEFNGAYIIPEDAPLGSYRFYFQDQDLQADRQFTVAQYRKPEFQVEVIPSTGETLRGDTVDVAIDASYFFGAPATDLVVNWSVTEMEYNLDVEGPYYNFGDRANFYYEPGDRFNFGPGQPFGKYVMGGEGITDGDGRLVIQLPANLLAEAGPGSRLVTVEASVTDVSNFPISARSDIVFHAAETYVGIKPATSFGTVDSSLDVDLTTVDWDGLAVGDSNIEVVFYQREWVPTRAKEFGQYFTRWDVNDTEVERVQVRTNEIGKGQATFTPPEGGIYLAVATVSDDSGQTQTSSTMMWVADSRYGGWRNDPTEKRMDLVVDKQEYRPGDVARVLVQSPFEGPVKAWLTIERGSLIEQHLITLDTNSDFLEIPISRDYAPNVFLTVHAVKGVDDTNRYADMRLGMIELIVSPEHLGINLDITPESDLYQPGDTAVFDILATDHQGRPLQANLSLALVDLAVLTLKSDNAPEIIDAFYARQPIRSQTGSGLIVSGEGLEVEIPDVVLGLGGGGGGDVEAARSFALAEDEDVRKNFPDTAFWDPKITTDASGRASAEIPLPDSVTTWQLSGKGVTDFASTGETLVGQESVKIISTLPLLIRPVTPRFFRVGDTMQLGAVIQNNSADLLEVTAELEATGLTLLDRAKQTVAVPAGGNQLVRWGVTVDDVSFADLTFRADAGEYRDATKPTFGIAPDQLLPVVRYTGEDIVGTSGVLDEAGRRVEAILLPPDIDVRQGAVNIQLTPSLGGVLKEALNSINNLDNQPDCAHTIAQRLLPNAATLAVIQDLGLEEPALAAELDQHILEDVVQIGQLQKGNGGWGWCYSEMSDPNLSATVLLSLAKAAEVGYPTNERSIRLATNYLDRQLEDVDRLNNMSDANRQAFFLYVLAEWDATELADLDALFTEHRALLDPYSKALLLLTYQQLGGSLHQQALLADLNGSVILSASGAHWEDAVPDWDNLSSDIRGTAMVINALARLDSDNAIIPNAVRWLTIARQAGHWTTGQDNAWSIMALSEWLVASGELEADYGYQVLANGQQLAKGQFSQDNINQAVNLEAPVEDLLLDDVNFLDFQRDEGDGRLYYTAHLNSFINADGLDPINRGFSVQRLYYDADCQPLESDCEPINEIEAGKQVRVDLTIIVPNDQPFVIVEDPLPAGAEAIDPGLDTSVSGAGGGIQDISQDFPFDYWGWWHFDRIEYRDDRVVFLSEFLPAGTYQYTYTMNTMIPGEFQAAPATARLEFFPEVFGRSNGSLFSIGN